MSAPRKLRDPKFYSARTKRAVNSGDDWHVFGLVERQPIWGEVPTEFFEGEWHFPKADGPEPLAVITYSDEPSPETGHVGWCWWAMGSMGDSPSYEAARDAAVAEIQRRRDRRMAVL